MKWIFLGLGVANAVCVPVMIAGYFLTGDRLDLVCVAVNAAATLLCGLNFHSIVRRDRAFAVLTHPRG